MEDQRKAMNGSISRGRGGRGGRGGAPRRNNYVDERLAWQQIGPSTDATGADVRPVYSNSDDYVSGHSHAALNGNGIPLGSGDSSLHEEELEQQWTSVCRQMAQLQTTKDLLAAKRQERSELIELRGEVETLSRALQEERHCNREAQANKESMLSALQQDRQARDDHIQQLAKQLEEKEAELSHHGQMLWNTQEVLQAKERLLQEHAERLSGAEQQLTALTEEISAHASNLKGREEELSQQRQQLADVEAQHADKETHWKTREGEYISAINDWDVYGKSLAQQLWQKEQEKVALEQYYLAQTSSLKQEKAELLRQLEAGQLGAAPQQQGLSQFTQTNGHRDGLQPVAPPNVPHLQFGSFNGLPAVQPGLPMRSVVELADLMRATGLLPQNAASARFISDSDVHLLQPHLAPLSWEEHYQPHYGTFGQLLRGHPQVFAFREDGAVFAAPLVHNDIAAGPGGCYPPGIHAPKAPAAGSPPAAVHAAPAVAPPTPTYQAAPRPIITAQKPAVRRKQERVLLVPPPPPKRAAEPAAPAPDAERGGAREANGGPPGFQQRTMRQNSKLSSSASANKDVAPPPGLPLPPSAVSKSSAAGAAPVTPADGGVDADRLPLDHKLKRNNRPKRQALEGQ